MIGAVLAGLTKANLAAGVAILVVLLVRRLVRARFGARAAYALWAAPLIAGVAVLLPHPARQAPLPPVMAQAVAVADVFDASAAPAVELAPAKAALDPTKIAFGVWLAGALAVAGLLGFHQARFVASLGRVTRERGRLRRAERSGVGPALVGWLRPWIVTPADFEKRFREGERALILAHEEIHLARGDAAANALACALQTACWFNPLAHLAARAMRVDQELACDAAVIDRFPAARRAYAELLLKTQTAAQPLPLGCHWPAHAAHPLKERIAMLKVPLPGRPLRAAGLAVAAALVGGLGALAWAAQPSKPVPPAPSPAPAIRNNGHLEPAEAAKLVGPGQTMLCKPDENRELHNCKILGNPFAQIATAADVQREWPAAAKARGLTGYVTLSCITDRARARLAPCSAYHYGGVAERPEWQADFAAAAIRVISIIRLKPNPGPDDAPLPKQGFYTIEFNDNPHMPGGPPVGPPVTRFPDFLPGPAKPTSAPVAQTSPRRIDVTYAPGNAPASPLITQPDWAAKPTAEDVARVYPKADQDGLGGAVTLDCRFAGDGRLTGCRVAAETPPGDGFGAAAMKLAAKFRAKPMSRDGVAVAGGAVRIPIKFVDPQGRDLVEAALRGEPTVTRPVWLEKPTPADIARLYPPEAARRGLSAEVTINCLIGADGRMANCSVALPAGRAGALPRDIEMDFGAATLQLAKIFRMAPTSSDGVATAGGLIRIPVIWQPPGRESAPGASAKAVIAPTWLRKPTLEELARYYPPEAARQRFEGITTLSCAAEKDGRLAGCTATEPTGFGKPDAMREDFRKATLDLAPLFQMTPQSVDGLRGGRVVIPIRWALPTDPKAVAAINALYDRNLPRQVERR